jgi:hypothetical protein
MVASPPPASVVKYRKKTIYFTHLKIFYSKHFVASAIYTPFFCAGVFERAWKEFILLSNLTYKL